MKRDASIQDALDFKDVILAPAEDAGSVTDISTKTRLTRTLSLNIPLVSTGKDSVTESALAIKMAQMGGIGVIHNNMPLGRQVEEVRRVKRAESRIVSNPITVAPESSLAEALDLMSTYKVSGLPVAEQPSQKVVGILTARDVRFAEDYAKTVGELMTKEIVTAKANISPADAKKLMHEKRIEKLVVLDDKGRCAGLITVRDIDQAMKYPGAARDQYGRLLVAAMVGTGKDGYDRAQAMADAGLDAVFVDTGCSGGKDAAKSVSDIRQQRSSEVQIVAGGVATPAAARSLIDAGADAILIDPYSVFGRGQAGFTAVLRVAEQCAMMDVPAIAAVCGNNGEIAKALGAGAAAVMINHLFAGSSEAPGKVAYRDGFAYKGSTPYLGSAQGIADHLMDELRVSMSIAGAKDIAALNKSAEFLRIRS